MNKTKKGLMYAGGILALVFAGIMILASIICFCAAPMLEIGDILTQAEIVEMGYTVEELNLLISTMRTMVKFIGGFLIVISVLDIVFGIRVIIDAKHFSNRKHNVITLLVVNAISGSILVVGFMIAALCMKFKSAEQIIDEVTKNNSNNVA